MCAIGSERREDGQTITRNHSFQISDGASENLSLNVRKNWNTADWHKLPPTIWSMICRVTGAQPPYIPGNLSMDPIDISHIWKEFPRP